MINKLAIGSVQFGLDYGISNESGIVANNEVRAILDYCREVGIDTIDTAYGYGNSEEKLGEQRIGDFKLVTKFPDTDEIQLSEYLRQSLSRLAVNKLYGYMAHNVNCLIKNPSIWQRLMGYKEEGIIKKIGFSLYRPEELLRLLDMGMVPDIIQIPYNILDNRFEGHFSTLRKENIEVHARSCFLQGLFFLKPENLPSFFDPIKHWMKQFQEMYLSADSKVNVLLNYVLYNSYIDKVVIGIDSLQQLKQNVNLVGAVHEQLASPETPVSEQILLPFNWPKIERETIKYHH